MPTNLQSRTIEIPIIFDVSGDTIVYGEDVSGDVIHNHLKFQITETAADCSGIREAFSEILYSDAEAALSADSNEQAPDASGVLFYKKAGARDKLGMAINQLFFHTENKLKHLDDTASDTTIAGDGIPDGSTGGTGAATYIKSKFIDSNGTTFDNVLKRVASTHLMGHSFAQGFLGENTIQNRDLSSNEDFKDQVDNFLLKNAEGVSLEVAGDEGDVVDDIGADPAGRLGKHHAILQSIFEQLLVYAREANPLGNGFDRFLGLSDSSDNQVGDVSGVLRPIPFKTGDTLVFYIRPRLYLKLDVTAGLHNKSTNPSGDGNDQIDQGTGAQWGTGNLFGNSGDAGAAQKLFNRIFDNGTLPVEGGAGDNPTGYRWLADLPYADDNGIGEKTVSERRDGLSAATKRSLTQQDTNLVLDTENGEGNGFHGLFDAHIWKIQVRIA